MLSRLRLRMRLCRLSLTVTAVPETHPHLMLHSETDLPFQTARLREADISLSAGQLSETATIHGLQTRQAGKPNRQSAKRTTKRRFTATAQIGILKRAGLERM